MIDRDAVTIKMKSVRPPTLPYFKAPNQTTRPDLPSNKIKNSKPFDTSYRYILIDE